jgi:hypothetical protein
VKVFEDRSADNTSEVIALAVARAKELEIEKIVVASGSGATAKRFMAVWPADQLVVVRHVCGFEGPDVQEMPPEAEKEILSSGAKLVTAAHAFGGFGRAVRRKYATYQADEIVANALRIFGQGTKVACEIALMACDAGYVRTDEMIISVGGTGTGADAALVLTPANTHSFFNMKVHEILCKSWT